MKKIFSVLIIILLGTLLTGCTIFNNEIYNRSVIVDIDVENFGEPIVPIAEAASKAVVGVSNYERIFGGALELQGVGTGVIYKTYVNLENGNVKPIDEILENDVIEDYEYYVITNRHVIELKVGVSSNVYIYLGEEDKEVSAEVLGYDSKVDIAILRFTHDKLYSELEFGDSDEMKKGNFAIAIGNPSGYNFYGSVTFGIISHPQRYLLEDTNNDNINDWNTEYIQHNVAINPGNSGGPLVNMNGDIIGINTMKLVSEDIDNMGFSIPSNIVFELIPYLEKGEVFPRLPLGIGFLQIGGGNGLSLDIKKTYKIPDEINYGLVVRNIEGTSIFINDLKINDIILTVNDVNIKYYYELLNLISADNNGNISLTVLRDGETLDITI